MKAVIFEKYGSPDVLEYREVEKPAPKAGEVLVKIQAASVNYFDWHALTGEPFMARMAFGLSKPKQPILGEDIAGIVEAVGPGASQFKPGDEVYGEIARYGSGGFAEYVCVPEQGVSLKPENLTFEEAAAVPMAAITALQCLRDGGKVQPGQQVLIHGAAGGVGTFAVQLAKYYGAEVTGVCSTRNVELVKSLGADHMIDYTREDFTQSGQQYDLIVAINGNRSIYDYRRALKPQGMYFMAGGSDKQIFQALLLGSLLSRKGGQKYGSFSAKVNQIDMIFLKELLEAGKIKPVIDRRYPLSETADALRYIGEGHARAKIVIRVN
jgi:NADPH:quinone reductase-like Zn-dependent oxidoreductase